MNKNILIKAGIIGMIAVLGGAFGAHALKEILSPEHLASFKTGVNYQMIHAVVLMFLFLTSIKFDSKQFRIASKLIFWGVILFSGSIYILTLKNIIGLEVLKFAGPITPIGGLLIITGWLFIVLGGVSLKK
tara:strand:- start:206 stop:598 length:393 start_codon:yes stop_codon:yes gene_type:complete